MDNSTATFCPACEFEGAMINGIACPSCGVLGRPEDFQRPQTSQTERLAVIAYLRHLGRDKGLPTAAERGNLPADQIAFATAAFRRAVNEAANHIEQGEHHRFQVGDEWRLPPAIGDVGPSLSDRQLRVLTVACDLADGRTDRPIAPERLFDACEALRVLTMTQDEFETYHATVWARIEVLQKKKN